MEKQLYKSCFASVYCSQKTGTNTVEKAWGRDFVPYLVSLLMLSLDSFQLISNALMYSRCEHLQWLLNCLCISDIQSGESFWLHGKHLSGRQDQFLWEASRWISEDGSHVEAHRQLFHPGCGILNELRQHKLLCMLLSLQGNVKYIESQCDLIPVLKSRSWKVWWYWYISRG